MSESTSATTSPQREPERQPLGQIFRKAGKRAIGGGIPGAAAMAAQVVTLLPLRTTMNQSFLALLLLALLKEYRYGHTTTRTAIRTLYADGGLGRFYRGMGPALLQGPLSRFGDTAANSGTLAILDEFKSTKDLPLGVKTAFASTAAAGWRIFLMPVDALKTTMQVEGVHGIPVLSNKIRVGGPMVVYHGALATYSATLVGHYPWFVTFNYLQEYLPKPDPEKAFQKFGRNAFIGFTSSVISDTCSNSLRVIKTTKQTHRTPITYAEAVKLVIDADGVAGLFGRGLSTRIIANGFQGLMFSVIWKALEEKFNARLDSKN